MSTRVSSNSRRPIVVIGSNGQVGYELVRSLSPFGPVCAFEHSRLDITNFDALRATLKTLAPMAIVNAAAFTAVDKAEDEPDLAAAVNGKAPGVLASIAEEFGACFVHYSTDYVFDGSASRPYRESDPVSPANTYGRTKLTGERAVMEIGSAAIILRTCWVYSNRRQNFLTTMRQLAQERTMIRVVEDQIGCPTTARFVAQATAVILAECGFSAPRLREQRGIYHLAAAGQTSWCEFARAIMRYSSACNDVAIEGISTAQYPTPAKRPAYSVLDTSRLRDAFGLYFPDWEVLLKQTLDR